MLGYCVYLSKDKKGKKKLTDIGLLVFRIQGLKTVFFGFLRIGWFSVFGYLDFQKIDKTYQSTSTANIQQS